MEWEMTIQQALTNSKVASLAKTCREQAGTVEKMQAQALSQEKEMDAKVSTLEAKLIKLTELANDMQSKNQELGSRMKIMEADSAKGWWARVKGA